MPGQSLECEHVLPVLPALTHLSLVRPPTINPDNKQLSIEYAWTHECCNQWKSDAEFIQVGVVDGKLQAQIKTDVLKKFIKKLNDNRKTTSSKSGNSLYACDEICEGEDFPPSGKIPEVLMVKLELIEKHIDDNLKELRKIYTLSSMNQLILSEIYLLICKFKLLMAFSSKSFEEQIILGMPVSKTAKSKEEIEAHMEWRAARVAMKDGTDYENFLTEIQILTM